MLHFLLLSLVVPSLAAPRALFASVFQSHMVLQRDTALSVWGFATPSLSIDVQFGGHVFASRADATGLWSVALPPTPIGGPSTIFANASDSTSQVLVDVLFGEVLLCTGQSNQDMPVSYAFNSSAEEAAGALYPSLRYMSVTANSSKVPLREFMSVSPWMRADASPTAIAGFSAVCWFTARDIHDGLRASGAGDVPVGMIHTALGGTAIQQWMSPAAAKACPPPTVGPAYPFTELYNAMVAPFFVIPGAPLSISLIEFYQGEANVLQSTYYSCALSAHARDYMASFRLNGDGRFLDVQLHPWNASTDPTSTYYYEDVPLLRDAQARAVAATPGTALVSAVDGGDPFAPATSVHPRSKQIPGRRFSQAALALRFALATPWASPRYASAIAGNPVGTTLTVNVRLTSAAGGEAPVLTWKPPSPSSNSARCPTDLTIPLFMCAGFEMQGSDGVWLPATGAIDARGTGLVLTATARVSGVRAIATRNGAAAWPIVNVYAADGDLPLLPWAAEPVGAQAAAQ